MSHIFFYFSIENAYKTLIFVNVGDTTKGQRNMKNAKTFCLDDIYKANDNISIQGLNDIGFGPGYVITNEDLRFETEQTKANAQRVLTVAASGDQALFYLLGGAKHVDTFDITYIAKITQEIKFAAIRQQIPYSEYLNILGNIQHAKKIIDIKPVKKLLHDMSPDVALFLQNQPIRLPYCNGLSLHNPDAQARILTSTEYARLQSMHPKTPSFIWSDITHLHTHIQGKYDVINASNIFDNIPNSLSTVINNLHPNLTPNGAIITESNYHETDYALKQLAQNFSGELDVILTKNKLNNLACIQRTH